MSRLAPIPVLLIAIALVPPALGQEKPGNSEKQSDQPAAQQKPGKQTEPPPGALVRLKPAWSDNEPYPGIYQLTFSPDGKLLVAGARDLKLRLWRLDKLASVEETKRILDGHRDVRTLSGVAFSPDGRWLASSAWDEQVIVWDTATGDARQRIDGGASLVEFSADGTVLYVVRQGSILHFDPATGKQLKQFDGLNIPLAISPAASLLAGQRRPEDRELTLIDPESGAVRGTLKGLTADPVGVHFSPDGKLLACGGRGESKIQVWDLSKGGEPRDTFDGHLNRIHALAFSPDGRFLASAGLDHTVRIWEISTGKEAASLDGHNGNVVSVAFSPDGRTLASGSSGPDDASVLVWNVFRIATGSGSETTTVDEKTLARLWDELGSGDRQTGLQAVGALQAAAERSVEYLTARLEATLAAADEERIRALIVQLNDDHYGTREVATTELKRLRPAADGLLLQTLESTQLPEVRLRIKLVLSLQPGASTLSTDERLRAERIIYLLENIVQGNPGAPSDPSLDPPADKKAAAAAKKLLERMSVYYPDAKISKLASLALQRAP